MCSIYEFFDCMDYRINVTAIRQRLSDIFGECPEYAAVDWLRQVLRIIESDWVRPFFDCDLDFRRLDDGSLCAYIRGSDMEEGRFIRHCVCEMIGNEFLWLNANSDYYRLDIFAVITCCQWPPAGVEIDDLESACKEIACYLADTHKLKAIWGHGCEQYDRDTDFESNEGYYLFFKAPNKAVGERIEAEVIRYFDNHGPCVPDDVAIEMDY